MKPSLTTTDRVISLLPACLALFLFLTAYYPALKILVMKWAHSDEYDHAFFTLPIILYMIWLQRNRIANLRAHLSFTGLALLLCSSVLYFFALLTQVHTIIALSFYLSLISSFIFLFGVRVIPMLFTPLILLLLLIPIPDQLYTQITSPLQLKVSQASEFVIRSIGISILREGNVMTIPSRTFEVVEACSGLRSMITLATLSIIMGFFMIKKTSSRLILLASSIPAAILMNIFRVTAMILLYHFFHIDLVEGTWHTIFGVIVFAVALGILLFVERILESWEKT